MDSRMNIQNALRQMTSGRGPLLDRIINTYLLIIFAVISVSGLGYMLFREVQYIAASAPCPDPLKSPITGVVELNADDYVADNVIDCSAVSIQIQNGGILRILPHITDNGDDSDDFGLVIQANNFTIDEGGLLDLEGQGYGAGAQAAHIGSGKSSVTTCSGGLCGGSGGGHGGAGGRGDPDGQAESGASGEVYGDELNPITLGSGGGESATAAVGGVGGGAIKLEVSGTLTVNGEINANGTDATASGGSGAGGGAGGSIWVEADGFAGTGNIFANGGRGGESDKYGGGGGGGRVAMRCTISNTFSGTALVAEGAGGIQDGQVGKIIGPSCYPLAPTNLQQYELTDDDPYTITAIDDGERTKKTTMVFKFMMSDIDNPSTLYGQVEIRKVGEAFTGAATHSGSQMAYTGTAIEGTVTAAGLTKTAEYKWRARVIDEHGIPGPWVEYEEDATEEIDFIVLGPPALLVQISGDAQTGTVAQALANPFVVEVQDAVGHLIFDETITWQVKQGGGSVSEEISTTDTNGRTETTLTLGTVAGTNNNKVDAIKVGVPGSPMRFIATANPGPLDHYQVEAPSVALRNTNFSPDVEIYARDAFENLITTATNTVSLSAVLADVGCPDTCTAGTGVLTPSQVTLTGGTATISNMQYDTAETIKIKADDVVTGYSGSVNIVTAFGQCFGVANDVANSPLTITENQVFTADASNGGVINCDQIDVTIQSPAQITLNSNAGLNLGVTVIAKSLDIQSGAAFNGSYSGYPIESGPGAGTDSWEGEPAGGSYGGYAQNTTNNQSKIYGSVYEPDSLGSGGGKARDETNGAGGGAIKIAVTNAFTHNGEIKSDGEDGAIDDYGGGGGSGGSVWVDTDVFDGTGTITANGGVGTGGLLGAAGGGSAGRIALYYNSGTYPVTDVTAVQTRGGDGHWENPEGGPGTVYVEDKDADPHHGGMVYVHSQFDSDRSGKAAIVEGDYQFKEIRLTGNGDLDILGNGSNLTVTSGSGLQGDNTGVLDVYGTVHLPDTVTVNNLTLGVRGDIASITDGTNTANMNITVGTVGKFDLHAGAWGASGGLYEFDTVDIQNGGVLFATGYNSGDSNYTNDYGVTLDANTVTIVSGGLVSADERGFPEGVGPGTGSGGGSFGGYGTHETNTSKVYGDVYEPVQLGSGGQKGSATYDGHGGSGGGAIKIVTTTLTNDGTITADGQNAYTGWAGGGGGGSGGAIWIDTSVFNGAGLVRSDGGDGKSGQSSPDGGGSGGRIAIYYESGNFPVTTVANVHSYGGGRTPGNATFGGAGTIYLEQKGVDNHHGAYLFVDNQRTSDNGRQAGLPEADYEFQTIRLTRYGHLDVIGVGSNLYVTDENALQGDNTSRLEGYGTIHLPDTVRINNLELGIRGDLASLIDGTDTSNMNITVGDVGKFHLYAWAWGCDRGFYEFDTVTIENGGNMILEDYVFDTGGQYGSFDMSGAYGIDMTLNTLTIDAGGFLHADERGFKAGGWHQDYAGGSHGGFGGGPSEDHTIYGDVYAPRNQGMKGSNGDMNYAGLGAAGGGTIELDAQTITLNGTISANGAGHTGGFRAGGSGAGGSILIFTDTINGTGVMRTNGGIGSGENAGSGGRIAVYYDDGNFPLSNVANMQSRGGNRSGRISGPGTVYLERDGIDIARGGLLYVDNANQNGKHAAVVEDDYQFAQVNLTRYGHLDILGETSTLTITSGAGLNGDSTFPDLDVYGTFIAPAVLAVNGVDVGIRGEILMGADPAVTQLTIGDTLQAGMTLYANTWAHDKNNQYTFGSLTIDQFGTMTLVSHYDGDNGTTTGDYGVTLDVENLTVATGGMITANELGYPAMQGPGGGQWAGNYGASHGGLGGNAATAKLNDDVYNPTLLGSGGSENNYSGYGGKGGGAIHFNVNDTATINGTISSNGGEGADAFRDGSGGAGGTITIDTDVLAGTGLIRANGGRHQNNNQNAGGGGGRIAVYYNSGSFPFSNSSNFQATGGYGSQRGGPGTMYVEQVGVHTPNQGELYLTNSGGNAQSGGLLEGDYVFELINLTNYGNLAVFGDTSSLTIPTQNGLTGDSTKPKLSVYGTLNLPVTFTASGVTMDMVGKITMGPDITQSILTFDSAGLNLYGQTNHHDKDDPIVFGQMIFNGTSSVLMDSYDDGDSNYTDDSGVYLESQSFIVSAGTTVSANQQGYRYGPGWNGDYQGTAYGGSSDSTNGYVHNSYGDLYEPTDLGSGNGGGAFKITTGTFENHGTISADGLTNQKKYTGTGGSIWIDAVDYVNDGIIRANGGNGQWAAYPNGSGGRIAIEYENGTFDLATVEAFGGGYPCCEWGGPGTIYVEHKGTHNEGAGDFYVKNQATRWGYGPTLTAGEYRFNDVHIMPSVAVWIKSNTSTDEGSGVVFDIDGDFTLYEGAALRGRDQGFGGGGGRGRGGNGPGSNGGGGGSHGGSGGLGQNDTVNSDTPGGEQYGSAVKPLAIGSGGGRSGTGAAGGPGGAAIAIISNAEDGVIQIDGDVYMNGGSGSVSGSAGGGGGAGGSIYLKACDIFVSSTGRLRAAGGNAGDSTYDGGGGGGGIISLNHTCESTITIDPAAEINVDQGTGYQAGGVGVFGQHSLPDVFGEEQYELDDTLIPVGGEIDQRAVKFRIQATDPDVGSELRPEIEVVRAGIGEAFDGTNAIQAESPVTYNGTPIDVQITLQRTNGGTGMVMESGGKVLGITDADLNYGEDYKWRARVYDVTEGVYGDWVEFGSNNDGVDFQIAPAPTCGNDTIEFGESCDGTDLGGEDCVSRGYDAGTLSCDGSCTFDESGCYNYMCGNDTTEPGELCDGTDLTGLDCTDFDDFDSGTLSCAGTCDAFDTSLCIKDPVCGNGALEAGEQCDDSNTTDGDGCSSSCVIEGFGGSCGDGTVQAGEGEQCDDGNTTSGDGCSNVCQTESAGFCGDGSVDAGEQCDDGNQVNGDGCSNICQNETALTGVCGNSIVEGEEQCDDGNTTSGDGCSNVCTTEASQADCGNGLLERGEQCDSADLGGESCSGLGFGSGTLTCSAQCTYVTDECVSTPFCGNGVIEPGEVCDGDNMANSCSDFFGYGSGTLTCNNQCQFDFTQCEEGEVASGLFGLPVTGLGLLLPITGAILTGGSILLALISLILAFPSLLKKDEKQPWGLVYDNKTRKPVAFAIVRLFSGKKLVVEKVTDLQGRYGFAVGDGNYEIEVRHEKYKKFRTKIRERQDEVASVNRDIAMDPKDNVRISFADMRKWFMAKFSDAREMFPTLSRYMYVAGFIFSIFATLMSPVVYNFLVIAFYVLVGIVYLLRGMKRGWGMVYDSTNKVGVEYAFVRLFDAKKGKMVDNVMTDKDGKYVFLAEAGIYNLLSSMKGYTFPSKKEKGKKKKTFYGDLVQVKHDKKRVLGVDLAMDPTRGVTKKAKKKQKKDGEEKVELREESKKESFGTPFGKK